METGSLMKKFIFIILLCILSIPAISFAQAGKEVTQALETGPSKMEDIDLNASDFSTETRVGLSNITGNNYSLSLSGHHHTLYRYKRFENNWRAGAYYSRIFSSRDSSSVGTSARYIYGTYRADYFILQWLTTYVGGGGYSDWIKGINIAGQGFCGFRLFAVQTPRTKLSFSFGYNYTYEDRFSPTPAKKSNSATQEISFTQKIGKAVTFEERAEVLEDVIHGYDVRVNSETALKVALVKHLSIVIGFNIRFDNRPAPTYKKLDTFTDLSLAVTF